MSTNPYQSPLESSSGSDEQLAPDTRTSLPLSRQELGAIACRCAAIAILLQAMVRSVSVLLVAKELASPSRAYPVQGSLELWLGLVGMMLSVCFTVAGCLLWRGANNLARHLVEDADSPINALPADRVTLLSIAIAGTGIWLVMSQLLSPSVWLGLISAVIADDTIDVGGPGFQIALCCNLVLLLIGCVFVVASRRIAAVLGRC
jgi:hypothetical protein